MRIKNILDALNEQISFELFTAELSLSDKVGWIELFKVAIDWNQRSLFFLWFSDASIKLDLFWIHVYRRSV